MIENMSSTIQKQKLYTQELKEVNFYLEYDPLYIADNIKVYIYNDSYGTLKFEFRQKNHYMETYNNELYYNDDKLIDYTIKFIIAYENARLEEIKKGYND